MKKTQPVRKNGLFISIHVLYFHIFTSMQNEDYIKKQIDQFAKVVAAALARLLKLKYDIGVQETVCYIQQEGVDPEIQDLLNTSTEQLRHKIEAGTIPVKSLPELIHFFIAATEIHIEANDKRSARELYSKATLAYDVFARESKSFDYELHLAIQNTKERLNG
jgi:hypothetical protein